jgi:KDO2-lipid IV(A) lauroyltransferase
MYYIVYSLLWLISLLPLKILYLFSDFCYVLVFYVFKYRKQVVLNNLRQAFPEKTETERITIAKKFYRNLIDSFIETIKLFSTGKKFLNKHCSADFTAINELATKGRSFQIHFSHQFNWEWVNLYCALHFPLPFVGVYMPLTSRLFEKILYRIRTRYGTVLLPATNMRESFIPWRNKLHSLVLVADQNPGHPNNAYWLNFFGKVTPFLKGPERSARGKACPVVFMFMRKKGRGYYHLEFTLVTEDASALSEKELTKMYAAALTHEMKEYPDYWLWSHRRWKWNWKPEYGEIIN